jgi:hypothetical protein
LRNVVIQPVLQNHPDVEALNAAALNTVRVATSLRAAAARSLRPA